MQICPLLQTNNHASTPLLSFLQAGCPFLPPNQQCQSTTGTESKKNNIEEWAYLSSEALSTSSKTKLPTHYFTHKCNIVFSNTSSSIKKYFKEKYWNAKNQSLKSSSGIKDKWIMNMQTLLIKCIKSNKAYPYLCTEIMKSLPTYIPNCWNAWRQYVNDTFAAVICI